MEKNGGSAATRGPLYLDIIDAPATNDTETTPEGIRFFGPRSFGASTSVVSLFVALQLVAFAVTMFVNNCPVNSPDEECLCMSLGRFSFQPLFENPLLGPSSSTLSQMGALQRTSAVQNLQKWRLVTSIWLHAGVVHLIVNVLSVMIVGIRLEQDYGPLRIGFIYLLSTFIGSSASAIFTRDISAVGSSGALFGLLGTMLSALIQNWRIYDDKHIAVAALAVITATNLIIGFLPLIDNYANIVGFLSGVLLGYMLLFNPQLGQMERKKGLYEYNIKSSMKQKLDRPAKRITALVLFSVICAGTLAAVLLGANANKYCSWCRYIDCLPTQKWSCSGKGHSL